ncbi:MAG: DNA topoisomerase, partial [bacterium]|nr:DNA topoisomerase [bacterium]
MNLIIVESPTKAKTLTRFLGNEYIITASMGHIRDLPSSKTGIDIEHDFAPDYVISKGKEEKVKELQDLAKKANVVILATDPDREGEAISWHIATLLGKKDFQRITFHEITESAIKEALKNPGKINMALVDAQQARRILDRLVGYKLSPILWRKVRRGLSAGRVQSVAVRLIVEREKEVLAFKPQEYWEIDAQFEGFKAKLIKQELKNKEEVDQLVQSLNGAEFKVEEVTKKEVKRSPAAPFTTSTLQQTAANLFGWTAKRT